MFAPETLREFHDHMEWADAEVWSVALRTDGASSDASLRGKLLHVHQTQRSYLRMWTDQPQGPVASKHVDSMFALHEWARTYYVDARAFLGAADSSTLETLVPEVFRRRMEQELGRGRALPGCGMGDLRLNGLTFHPGTPSNLSALQPQAIRPPVHHPKPSRGSSARAERARSSPGAQTNGFPTVASPASCKRMLGGERSGMHTRSRSMSSLRILHDGQEARVLERSQPMAKAAEICLVRGE